MNLGNLTKEQKKYMGLGVGISAIVLVLGLVGIRYSFSSIAEVKEELVELTEKIEQSDRAMGKLSQVEQDYNQTVAAIKLQLKNIPPARNYYSWATEIIYGEGRLSMLEIESVDEVNTPDKTVNLKETAPIQFEAYQLRIVANGNYDQIKTFIANIEDNYPLARFTGLEINVGGSIEQHNVQLFVEWPMYPQQIERIWASVESVQRKWMKRANQHQNTETKVTVARPKPEPAFAEPPAQNIAQTPKKPVVKPEPETVMPVRPVPTVVTKTETPEAAPVQKPVPVVNNPHLVKPIEPPVLPYEKTPVAEPIVKSTDPVPVITKKSPVIAVPSADPIPEKRLEIIPAPMVEKEIMPEPKVAVQSESVEKPVPVVQESGPAVVKIVPEPIPEEMPVEVPAVVLTEKPELEKPVSKDDGLESILASLSDYEEKSEEQPVEPPIAVVAAPSESPVQPGEEQEDELGSLLASLEAQKVEHEQVKPEEVPVINPPESVDMELESLLAAHSEAASEKNHISEQSREEVNTLQPELAPAASADPIPMQEAQLVNHEVMPEESEPVAASKDSLGDLLASLGSHGMDDPEGNGDEANSTSSSDPEALESFLKQLEDEKNSGEQQPIEQPKPAIIKPAVKVADEYVSTGKSAAILTALLSKEEPVEAASLSSFLDTIVEDIND